MCIRDRTRICPSSTTQFPQQRTNRCLQSLHTEASRAAVHWGRPGQMLSRALCLGPGLRNSHTAVHIPNLGTDVQSLRAHQAGPHPVLPLP